MKAVRQTARALAADRSTKLLPVIVAHIIFIGAIGIAIGKTASAAESGASSDTVFINVEAHGIAFSALYFWIIPAVFLSSVIGVSQTEAAIPRILRRFQIDLDRLLSPDEFRMLTAVQEISQTEAAIPRILRRFQIDNDRLLSPDAFQMLTAIQEVARLAVPIEIKILNDCLDKDQERVVYGGIYSWQPSKCQPKIPLSRGGANADSQTSEYDLLREDTSENTINRLGFSGGRASQLISTPPFSQWKSDDTLSYATLILGMLTGITISGLVPPHGIIDCRRIAELCLCAPWILSPLLDILLAHLLPLSSDQLTALFWGTFIKDFLMTVATVGGLLSTIVGVLNRCECYTNWGRSGVALPQMPEVATTLVHRINTVYPAVTFTSIGIELVIIPLFICFRYHRAVRVFIQRDDRQSNAVWLWKGYRKMQGAIEYFLNLKPLRCFRRANLTKSLTMLVEGGESHEMQNLTQAETEQAGETDGNFQERRRTISIPEDIPRYGTGDGGSALRSGVGGLPILETRRRNTEHQDEAFSSGPLQGEQVPKRKPNSINSPVRSFQPRP